MINIVVNSDSKYQVNKLAVQAAVMEILQQNSIAGNIQIGVSIVGDKKIHEFNKKYRGFDKPTNILTFALQDPAGEDQLQYVSRMGGFVKSPDKTTYLGDIVISHPMVVKDAALEGISTEDELLFLVQHGTRHLLGLHHE
jgi:probable rRNA maturation factor